jgi:hypothetical protein
LGSIAAYNYLKISKMWREARQRAELDPQTGSRPPPGDGTVQGEDFELQLSDDEDDDVDAREWDDRLRRELMGTSDQGPGRHFGSETLVTIRSP